MIEREEDRDEEQNTHAAEDRRADRVGIRRDEPPLFEDQPAKPSIDSDNEFDHTVVPPFSCAGAAGFNSSSLRKRSSNDAIRSCAVVSAPNGPPLAMATLSGRGLATAQRKTS